MERKKGGLGRIAPIRSKFKWGATKEETQALKRDYSQKEMVELIDRYARFAKIKTHRDEMLGIKDRHYTLTMEMNQTRGMQLKSFDDGFRAGLHNYKDRERLEKQFKLEDQQNRNKTVARAKTYYHQNYSLSKSFKNSMERRTKKIKTIEKAKDREKS